MKQDYTANKNLIFDLESRLNTIIDLELKDELSTVKNFERLNDEKITPYFLKLAKAPENNVSLESLRDDNNEHFKTDREREDSIYKFYRDLYKKTDPSPNTAHNLTIEDFLGDVVYEEVINSKLTMDERTILDRPLTFSELDNSMKKAKINSFPGIDGISNRFIQENWELFRVPLFKYAIKCYEKGVLTDNFRSAKIRLIPKKGDCSKIKNWRPISLLNCFYKIISRAIAERLKSVINKITRMGQKGYNSEKYCQEVLISLVDEIEMAKVKNIRKAFDTIYRRQLEACSNTLFSSSRAWGNSLFFMASKASRSVRSISSRLFLMVLRPRDHGLGESGNGWYLAKSDDNLNCLAAGGHLAQLDAAHHHPDARLDEVRAQPARLVYLAQGLLLFALHREALLAAALLVLEVDVEL